MSYQLRRALPYSSVSLVHRLFYTPSADLTVAGEPTQMPVGSAHFFTPAPKQPAKRLRNFFNFDFWKIVAWVAGFVMAIIYTVWLFQDIIVYLNR